MDESGEPFGWGAVWRRLSATNVAERGGAEAPESAAPLLVLPNGVDSPPTTEGHGHVSLRAGELDGGLSSRLGAALDGIAPSAAVSGWLPALFVCAAAALGILACLRARSELREALSSPEWLDGAEEAEEARAPLRPQGARTVYVQAAQPSRAPAADGRQSDSESAPHAPGAAPATVPEARVRPSE